MRPVSGMVLTALVSIAAWSAGSAPVFDPHGDPETGVQRVLTDPPTRGRCQQCHPTHGDRWVEPYPVTLFTEDTNRLAFWSEGYERCHRERPDNYPLEERDRMPETEPDAGYFEANAGGFRRPGVALRGRWPGEAVYTRGDVTAGGRYLSPHAQDPDMPLRGEGGEGLCLNCHDPHGGASRRDLLVEEYGGIGGHAAVGPPSQYRLCFSCHGKDGPAGMEPENRLVEDWYDGGLNGERAGHRIRMNPRIAISWPAHVRTGDMLPCYDCHNPHGSRGNNGVEPNAFLLSDERAGWSGLTDTLDDPLQSRRFCLGCHVPSDGVPGSQIVEGIVMNTLTDLEPHRSDSPRSCHDCHGRDYSSPTANNVHNPSGGG